MADVIKFKDAFQSRLLKGNKAMLDAYESLDPESETYYEDLEAVSKMQKEIANDYRNYGALEMAEDRNALERERTKVEKRNGIVRNIISVFGIGVTLLTFIVGERNRKENIKRISAFEDEHAYLKLSDRTMAQDAVKEDNKKPLLPIFGK